MLLINEFADLDCAPARCVASLASITRSLTRGCCLCADELASKCRRKSAVRHQKGLRAAALSLGERTHVAKSRQVARRVKQFWDERQVQTQSLEELQRQGRHS